MQNTTIYDKNWTNLVFDGRNKSYGAYQLRNENEKTIFTALLIATGILITFFGIIAMNKSDNHKIIVDPIITPIEISRFQIEVPKKTTVAVTPVTNNKIKKIAAITSKHTIVAYPIDSTPLAPTGTTPMTGTESGSMNTSNTGTTTITNSTSATTTTEIPLITKKPIESELLDKNAEFPGGIHEFLNYVGKNFKIPEDEGLNIKVQVQFIVEIDGTLSGIKAIKDPGYGMGQEAIRVLKSLKTKWEPGIYKGEKVRTLYTLPIAIQSPE
jgi:periplasmic protein TonB